MSLASQFAEVDWDLISSYGGLLSLATLSVYAGSYGALPNEADHDEDSEGAVVPSNAERMTSGDAWLFPVVGSVVLFSLYLVVKFAGTAWINWLLGWYFSIAGVGSVWKSSSSLLQWALGVPSWEKAAGKRLYILKAYVMRGDREEAFWSPLVLLPLSVLPSAAYHFWDTSRRSVLATDILGLSFSHNAISLLQLDSFRTGSILLSGLFLYDIWWVFGTEVMVKVATTLDLPIKILWPKSLLFSGARGFTMLGLGDIVIPGIFVALALRYDYYRFTEAHKEAPSTESSDAVAQPPSSKKASFKSAAKPYFAATLTAYVLGLVTTMVVMHVFRKAQPALLYLSPACILSFVVTATVRGEFWAAWNWCDMPESVEEHEVETERDGKSETGEKVAAAEVEEEKEEDEEEEKKKGVVEAGGAVGPENGHWPVDCAVGVTVSCPPGGLFQRALRWCLFPESVE